MSWRERRRCGRVILGAVVRRWAVLSLLIGLCGGCAMRDMLPTGPVIGAWERTLGWSNPEPSSAEYTHPPAVSYPVLPLQVWGVSYAVDLVIVSDHPDWDMHEYALLHDPSGPVWLAKDTRAADLSQTLLADLPHIETWYPELPLERRAAPVEVQDLSTPDLLDIRLQYTNLDDQRVEVSFKGSPPTRAQARRNGNVMGHSRDQLLAALDLSHLNFAKKAQITIDGERRRVSRVLGLVPLRMALKQTQGGLTTTEFTQRPDPEDTRAFLTTHTSVDGPPVEQRWEVRDEPGVVLARTQDPRRTLTYRYLQGEGALELVGMTVHQWGLANPTAHVAFSPALPDLRRRFTGRHVSRFVIDIGGQENHAVGRVEVAWGAEGPEVWVLPEAPRWTLDRPLKSTISFNEGEGVRVWTERLSDP